MDLGAAGFGLLGIAGAVGAVLGTVAAERVTKALGPGTALLATIVVSAVATTMIGALPSVPMAFMMIAVVGFFGTAWNVITVSLRQTLIPDELLGRVNSVYRFFGWGMIPVGALVGGTLVAVADLAMSREAALRAPLLISGAAHLLLLLYALPRLNNARIDKAKAAHAATEEQARA